MDVVALLLMLRSTAKRTACLCWIAALLDGFGEVRRELFFDVAVQAIGAKGIGDARPQRDITPSLERDLLRR